MEKIFFSEEQRFTQWWVWAIMTAALLAMIVPIAISVQQEWIAGLSYSEQPESVTETVIAGLVSFFVMVGIFTLVFASRLKTKITSRGLFVAYPPIYRKWRQLAPEAIDHYELRKYKAKREYGGYGVRRRRRSGQAYIVSGNIGLQLHLKNGKKLLIGTQKKQAVESAMKKMMELR